MACACAAIPTAHPTAEPVSEIPERLSLERFAAPWDRRAVRDAGADAADVHAELLRRYCEPGRAYHTPAHIAHCLGFFDLARDHMDDPDAVEIGLWFHDAIYEAGSPDNEHESALLFRERAGDRFDPAFADTVYALVMVTRHQEEPRTTDQRFIVDIDLSSFGLPWEQFRSDSDAVREEFAHLPDAEFYPAQIAFLERLGARKPFFHTEFFRQRHERCAAENIPRYLAELRAEYPAR